MCGIVGILGKHEVAPVILEALRRLEYRGYDSAGIATLNDGRLDRRRAVGKLVNLSIFWCTSRLRGKAGIGHTRWATHGAGDGGERASAPGRDGGGRPQRHHREFPPSCAPNWPPPGVGFTNPKPTPNRRPADPPVHGPGHDPERGGRATLAARRGLRPVFLFEGEDDLMIAARKGSPLAIGHGEGEMFVGSDAIALAPLTDTHHLSRRGRLGRRHPRRRRDLRRREGRRANRPVSRIEVDATRVEKAGYRHFMAKEIAEQPARAERGAGAPPDARTALACPRPWISPAATA
jgi:glutamine---fructose-6-phosphate transaminase (isomerizing)